MFCGILQIRQSQQTKQTYQYKNTKEKSYKANAAIYYNKICRKQTASNLTNTSFCE